MQCYACRKWSHLARTEGLETYLCHICDLETDGLANPAVTTTISKILGHNCLVFLRLKNFSSVQFSLFISVPPHSKSTTIII